MLTSAVLVDVTPGNVLKGMSGHRTRDGEASSASAEQDKNGQGGVGVGVRPG